MQRETYQYILQSPLLVDLYARGYIYQSTNLEELDKLITSQKIVAYVGFDCTAKSFHVGNLMQIMIMRRLQQHGHVPVILLGGATTRIGDPSDKQGLRKMLTLDEIEKNKQSLMSTFNKFLDFSSTNAAVIVDNLEWLSDIKYLDFLRDYGVHFSINRMLSLDSVRLRLERQSPLTFLEFNYMLLQAYDFVELYKRYKCQLQFGGSEQWSNIINGVELGRKIAGAELFGITTPLVTTSAGVKMGKTAEGAVWLNADMLSPYDYWQFWRNTADADVIRFMKIYTDLSLVEIEKFISVEGKDLNDVKKLLADEITTICHGNDAAIAARKTAEETFEYGINSESLPCYIISSEDLGDGIPLYRLLVIVKLCESNNAAKRAVQGKGIKLNDVVVEDEYFLVKQHHIMIGRGLKISFGKKKNVLIKI